MHMHNGRCYCIPNVHKNRNATSEDIGRCVAAVCTRFWCVACSKAYSFTIVSHEIFLGLVRLLGTSEKMPEFKLSLPCPFWECGGGRDYGSWLTRYYPTYNHLQRYQHSKIYCILQAIRAIHSVYKTLQHLHNVMYYKPITPSKAKLWCVMHSVTDHIQHCRFVLVL